MHRRKFIAAAIGAGMLGRLPAGAAAAPRSAISGTVPDDFADRIIPIPDAERASRVEKARRLMRGAGIDLLLLEGGTTMRYFTGVRWGRSERTFLLALPASGDPWYVAPKFEESRAAEQVAPAPVYTWEEDESPFELLAKTASERGLSTATVALEESVRYFVTEGVGKALASAKIVNGTAVTAECRAVKSDAEIALMQVANDITAEVFKHAVTTLRAGMKERELGGIISKKFSEYGVRGGALVLFGKAAAHPHGLEEESTLAEGDIVLIDGGCSAAEYQSDVTRTTVFGTPTDRMKKIFDVVLRSQSEGLRAARPGVTAESIDAAARQVITDAGFGPGYRYLTHRLGHGIGMEGHEWYYLVKGNARVEKTGEVHSNEPGIYLPGEFGVRIEDEMVITGDGARLMLPPPSSLGEIFG